MRDDYHYLPGVLHEIATIAGLPAALAIAEARGGARVHFPGHAGAGHWLIELVGEEAAAKICGHFRSRRGGQSVEIPLGPKNFYMKARKTYAALSAQGLSKEEIARKLGVTARTLRNWSAGDAPDPRQQSLF